MVRLADDASTEVDRRVRGFCTDLANRARQLRPGGAADLSSIRMGVKSDDLSREVRTPRKQADYVSRGWSWVCWSAHMSDKARHVFIRVPSRPGAHPKDLFGDQFPAFKALWSQALARHGLVNYNAKVGWSDTDWHHVELPKSRIGRSHPRAQACLEEYVRMTELEGRPRNRKFEASYRKDLQPYLQRVREAPAKTPQSAPSQPLSGPTLRRT